ncbi:helix-turn-helix domain-containing protein [Mycolicibacterium llatzerense]|uniref:helix-turn-helix domain-containing protein n=1 Tax=Mycolicibacterium llatzerense TaxID=280871 RepID=UPI0021B5547D|nr:helix-turn-helix domain-containing protein [Mycolicibacterium llatzerense]MCT7373186.1 hypothetical protein [Mycolicibacterium llatzerense]
MTEFDLKRFGEIVRARREQLGYQQEEMPDRGGPSSTTMSQLERGLLRRPSAKTLRKLDVGLSWSPGSAATTLHGGNPREASDAKHPEPVLGDTRPQAPRADWPAVGSLAELPGYPSSFDHLFIEWSRNRDNMIHAEMQYALMRGINPVAARGELEEAARAYDAFNTGDGWNPPWFTAPKKHDLIGAQSSEEQSTEGGQDGLESASQSAAPSPVDKSKKNPDELADEGESASARLGAAVEVGRPKLQVEDVSEDA